MAVSNPQLPSLTPAYGQIQETLQQRAALARQAPPSGLGTMAAATGAVKGIADKQIQFARDIFKIEFSNRLAAAREEKEREFEGRFDVVFDEQKVNELADEWETDPENLKPALLGAKFKDQKTASEAIGKAVYEALSLVKLEVEKEPPGSTVGQGPTPTQQVPVPGPVQGMAGGQSMQVPKMAETKYPTVGEGGEPDTFSEFQPAEGPAISREEMLADLEGKIAILDQTPKSATGYRRFQIKETFNPETKLYEYTRVDRLGKEPTQVVMGADGKPLVSARPLMLKTHPESLELTQVLPTGGTKDVTGGTPLPKGKKLKTRPDELSQRQKTVMGTMQTEMEKKPNFKAVQQVKMSSGNILRLMSLDYEALTEQIRTNIARTVGQEKGPLNEGDIKRAGGSQGIFDSMSRNFSSMATGDFDEKTYTQFRNAVRSINNNALITEERLINDTVSDYRKSGYMEDVSPDYMRDVLAMPDISGLTDKRLSMFTGQDIKDAIKFMKDEGIDSEDNELLVRTAYILREAKKEKAKKMKGAK